MNKRFIYIAVISFLSIAVSAQDKKADLGTEVINVVKAYNPEVSDAFKIKISPDEELDQVTKQKIEYKQMSTEVVSTFTPSNIKAKSQPRNNISNSELNNFVVLGYGNYKTPLVEVYLNNEKVKEQRYGLSIQHLSSEGGIENVRFNDAFLNTSIGGFYWKQFKNYQLKTNLAYKYQAVNWYGVPDSVVTDELVDKLNVGQYYQTIQGDASYTYNGKKRDAIFKSSSFTAYRMWDRYDSFENRIKVDGNFAIPVEDQFIKIKAEVDFMDTHFAQNMDATSSVSNKFLNIGIIPSFSIIKDNVSLSLGFAAVYSADLSGDDDQFRLYPRVFASVNIVDDLMIAYASIDGEMRQNSLQSVVAEMPYLSPTMDVTPTSVMYDASAGIKGKLLPELSYNTNISYRLENGFVQFIDSKGDFPLVGTPKGWDAWNSFNAVQDTVGIFEFFAEVEYKVIKDLNVSANFMFNGFSSKNFDKVYNKPNLKISATANYRFLEDFTVGTSMYFVGERNYINNPVSASVTEEGQLPAYFDLNLNAGYDINKKIGAFLRLNNILNSDYELYKNYPVQGFQIMAGATYKF
jgi:hypothetical protein